MIVWGEENRVQHYSHGRQDDTVTGRLQYSHLNGFVHAGIASTLDGKDIHNEPLPETEESASE